MDAPVCLATKDSNALADFDAAMDDTENLARCKCLPDCESISYDVQVYAPTYNECTLIVTRCVP